MSGAAEIVVEAMRSPHCVKWPEKPTKENPAPVQIWTVIETARPFRMVRGPFDTENEANAAIVALRAEIACAALDSRYRARASSSFSDWIDDEMVVAAMEKIPGCDHDAMVDALGAAFNVWRTRS